MGDYPIFEIKASPMMKLFRGYCPHGDEYLITFEIEDHKCYSCMRCASAIEDWRKVDREEYYTKYPEFRPDPEIRVTLDEADKGPDGWRIKK